ncbi:MAG: hypothetical protein ACNI26_16530 [Terasakiella sp.]
MDQNRHPALDAGSIKNQQVKYRSLNEDGSPIGVGDDSLGLCQ